MKIVDEVPSVTEFAPSQEIEVALPAVIAPPSVPVEIITAQRVPVQRSYQNILSRLKSLAAMAGEDWYYRFPVYNRREGRQDFIEGPSIKCATAVAREYGNCAVDCRAMDHGPHTIFLARFIDMETGFQLTRPFQQRKSQQTMRGDAERNADIAFQIGASKATRNVICNALEVFTTFAFEQAKQSLVEKVGKQLDSYKAKVVKRLEEMHIELANVERTIGKAAREWLAPDIARIIAELQAIQDGMARKDDLYPPSQPTQEMTGSKLDQFAVPETNKNGAEGASEAGTKALKEKRNDGQGPTKAVG